MFAAFDVECRGYLTLEGVKRVFAEVCPGMSAEVVEDAFAEADERGRGKVSPFQPWLRLSPLTAPIPRVPVKPASVPEDGVYGGGRGRPRSRRVDALAEGALRGSQMREDQASGPAAQRPRAHAPGSGRRPLG